MCACVCVESSLYYCPIGIYVSKQMCIYVWCRCCCSRVSGSACSLTHTHSHVLLFGILWPVDRFRCPEHFFFFFEIFSQTQTGRFEDLQTGNTAAGDPITFRLWLHTAVATNENRKRSLRSSFFLFYICFDYFHPISIDVFVYQLWPMIAAYSLHFIPLNQHKNLDASRCDTASR